MIRRFIIALAAFSGASSFAAPLCQVRSPAPPLLLIGENHNDPRMKQIENDEMADVRAGNAIFAQESWVSGNAIDESLWPKQLGLAPHQAVGMEEEQSLCTATYIHNLLDYDVQFYSFTAALRSNNSEAIATALVLTREARKHLLTDLDHYEFTKQLSSSHTWPVSTTAQMVPTSQAEAVAWLEEETKWGPALHEFVKVLAEHVADNPTLPESGIQILLEGTAMDATSAQRTRILNVLVVDWRNQSMGRGIAKAYCAAAKDGKSLKALVGSEHLRGLHRILNTLLPNPVQVTERNLNALQLNDTSEAQ